MLYTFLRFVFCLFNGALNTSKYAALILDGSFYGWENWSVTLREEHRVWMFENRALKQIFEPKRDAVTGEWRRLHKEKLYGLYSSTNIVRVIKAGRIRWEGHVARIKGVCGKSEGKTSLERLRRRWEYNIKMDLRQVGWGGTDWIDLAQDRDK
jgi:hypothetical protein